MRTTLRKLPSVVLLGTALVAAGCGSDSDGGGPLSPARNIAGTWKATAPATVSIETDFCTADLSLMVTQNWTVTLEITPGDDDNAVDVQMSFVTSDSQIVSSCGGTGVVPEVSPMFLTGNVSGTRLELKSGTTPVGTFNFTTDQMTGTLDYSWCIVFCQREYSAPNAVILRRQ